MTKRDFKTNLEILIREYLIDNQDKRDLIDGIVFHYTREEPNKESYGELVFSSDKKDVLFKIKAIDYK
jgi:hypothetical protein